MPEVSRFFGIRIVFDYNDHAPPHFHAIYEGRKAAFDIRTLPDDRRGAAAPRERFCGGMGAQLQSELEAAWEAVRHGQPPAKIAPLE